MKKYRHLPQIEYEENDEGKLVVVENNAYFLHLGFWGIVRNYNFYPEYFERAFRLKDVRELFESIRNIFVYLALMVIRILILPVLPLISAAATMREVNHSHEQYLLRKAVLECWLYERLSAKEIGADAGSVSIYPYNK